MFPKDTHVCYTSKVFKLILLFTLKLCFAEPAKTSESYWQQFQNDLKAPVATETSKQVLFSGTLITAILVLGEDQIIDPTQEEVTEHKPLGRYSKYGDIAGQLYPNLAYIFGMTAYSEVYSDSDKSDYAILMIKSTLYAGLVSTALKTIVREPRPQDSNIKTSFPSGHSTTAFAFASTVASLHNWYWGVGAYSLAAAVAFSRINDNRHYIHDVAAGATIGISYGLSLAEQYKKTKEYSPTEFIIIPSSDGLFAKYIYFF